MSPPLLGFDEPHDDDDRDGGVAADTEARARAEGQSINEIIDEDRELLEQLAK